MNQQVNPRHFRVIRLLPTKLEGERRWETKKWGFPGNFIRPLIKTWESGVSETITPEPLRETFEESWGRKKRRTCTHKQSSPRRSCQKYEKRNSESYLWRNRKQTNLAGETFQWFLIFIGDLVLTPMPKIMDHWLKHNIIYILRNIVRVYLLYSFQYYIRSAAELQFILPIEVK